MSAALNRNRIGWGRAPFGWRTSGAAPPSNSTIGWYRRSPARVSGGIAAGFHNAGKLFRGWVDGERATRRWNARETVGSPCSPARVHRSVLRRHRCCSARRGRGRAGLGARHRRAGGHVLVRSTGCVAVRTAGTTATATACPCSCSCSCARAVRGAGAAAGGFRKEQLLVGLNSIITYVVGIVVLPFLVKGSIVMEILW